MWIYTFSDFPFNLTKRYYQYQWIDWYWKLMVSETSKHIIMLPIKTITSVFNISTFYIFLPWFNDPNLTGNHETIYQNNDEFILCGVKIKTNPENLSVPCIRLKWVIEWFLFIAKWAIFQLYLLWQEQITFWYDNDDVHLVLDQHAECYLTETKFCM